MTFKYYTSVSDLIDSYDSDKTMEQLPINLVQKLIHAYELGYKHATEEEQPDPAEFDTDWEQETQNES